MKHWLTRLQMARELATRANRVRRALAAGAVSFSEAHAWLMDASATVADLCRA